MCLAIPGKVTAIFEEAGLRMGNIDYSGTVSKACLEYVPDIEIGQYTVVHAGFAISVINEEEAAESVDAWRELTDAVAARHGTDIFGNRLPDTD